MANKKVRVAIIGVGNCASSLVQGVLHKAAPRIDPVARGMMRNAPEHGQRVRTA